MLFMISVLVNYNNPGGSNVMTRWYLDVLILLDVLGCSGFEGDTWPEKFKNCRTRL